MKKFIFGALLATSPMFSHTLERYFTEGETIEEQIDVLDQKMNHVLSLLRYCIDVQCQIKEQLDDEKSTKYQPDFKG